MGAEVFASFEVAASYALIAGGIGTAAFGIVDVAFKSAAPYFTLFGLQPANEAGFDKLSELWKDDAGLKQNLIKILGDDSFESHLKQLYLDGELEGQIHEILSLAFGLLAEQEGVAPKSGQDVTPSVKIVITPALKFEFKLRAAITQAKNAYRNRTRGLASVIAVCLALVGAVNQVPSGSVGFDWTMLLIWLFLGIVAVPIAPMAKDFAGRLSDGSKAVRMLPSRGLD